MKQVLVTACYQTYGRPVFNTYDFVEEPLNGSANTLKDRNKNGALTSPAFLGPRDDSQIS